jgi:hypothetical protein
MSPRLTENRRAAERELRRLIAWLGDDELRVLVLLVRRVLCGQRRYGRLDLARDPRDFAHEGLEELLDATFYLSAGLLRLGRSRRARRA